LYVFSAIAYSSFFLQFFDRKGIFKRGDPDGVEFFVKQVGPDVEIGLVKGGERRVLRSVPNAKAQVQVVLASGNGFFDIQSNSPSCSTTTIPS
jgi:hypothetical protein